MQDPKETLRAAIVEKLTARIQSGEATAAEYEVARKIVTDPSFSFSAVKAGDFGETARQVAEDFPFQDDDGREAFH